MVRRTKTVITKKIWSTITYDLYEFVEMIMETKGFPDISDTVEYIISRYRTLYDKGIE
jgi:hypothetical protein